MTGRNRSTRAVSLAAGLIVLFGLTVGATGAPDQGDVRMLSDVSVDAVDGATVVSLYGLAGAEWDAATDSDGQTVRLRFEGVRPEFMPGNLVLNDSRVASVGFTEETGEDGTPATVVSIHGEAAIAHEVIVRDDRLDVRIVKTGEAAVAKAAPAPPPPAAPAPSQRPAASGPGSLLGVDVEGTADRTIVRMQTEGAAPEVKTFTLENPPRLVIDLVGLVNKVRAQKIPLDLPQAERLRIGQHPGKVRLVLDGSEASPFAQRDVAVSGDGVVLTIGAAQGAAGLTAALPAVATEAPAETVAVATEPDACWSGCWEPRVRTAAAIAVGWRRHGPT